MSTPTGEPGDHPPAADPGRCVILVPVGHHVEPHCDLSLRQLEGLGYPVRRLYGFAQIDVARNVLATQAIDDGFAELMWIDADMAFEPRSVARLRSLNLPLVCGLYPTKVEKRLTSLLLPGTKEIVFGRCGGLTEVYYPATGFLFTRRQVYLDVVRHHALPRCDRGEAGSMWPFFLPMLHRNGEKLLYLGEDYAFAERARQCGYRPMADTTIRLQHIGMYGYSWEDLGPGLSRLETCRVQFSQLRSRQAEGAALESR